MKKKSELFFVILLFVVSAIILLIGIWKNNNTVKIAGCTLLLIVNLINIVKGFKRWNNGKL